MKTIYGMQTLRIVGISGVGKTTLIENIMKKNPTLIHASYGEYFKKYGERANSKLREFLFRSSGLILLDEHLEIGDDDLSDAYKEEKTIGMFFLEVSPDMLICRRHSDHKRNRPLDRNEIINEQLKAKKRAKLLAKNLKIPMCAVLNGSVKRNTYLLKLFIDKCVCKQ